MNVDNYITLALVAAAVLLAAGPQLWAWAKKVWPFGRTPTATQQTTLASLVAARETLRAVLPPDVDAAVWKAVGDWRATP